MSEDAVPPTGQNADAYRAEALGVLDVIKQIKTNAEEQLAEAEGSRKKADSEALFAFQAKGHAEEHSTAVANFKGKAEADLNTIATNKQNSDALVAAITTGKATSDGEIKAIGERRKEVDQAALDIIKAAQAGTSHLEEVESLKEAADASSKATNAALEAANLAKTEVEAGKKLVDGLSVKAQELTTNIAANQKTSTEKSGQIDALLMEAKISEGQLKVVLDHLSKSDEIATGHEVRVAELSKELTELINRVENLLPGATSAGLASSFSAQKSRFARPQSRWLSTFIICMVLLTVIALPSFLAAVGVNWFGHAQDSWDGTLRSLIMRLPILFPLIWLAILAGRNYMLSLRLEEDYAYKEAISTAFEGYKREMEKIVVVDGAVPPPITTLCTNVLRAIAERPGRIYEGKQQDMNLMTEAQGAAEKVKDIAKRQVSSK